MHSFFENIVMQMGNIAFEHKHYNLVYRIEAIRNITRLKTCPQLMGLTFICIENILKKKKKIHNKERLSRSYINNKY